MKVVIWLGCIFTSSCIAVLLNSAGIVLGGIPTVLLYGGAIFLARMLCRKWDGHKQNKEMNYDDTEQNGE